MNSTASPIWALFIGGPLHGTWSQLPDVLARFEYHLNDGGMVPYAPRLTLALTPGHALYAPIGMSDTTIATLAASVASSPPTPRP